MPQLFLSVVACSTIGTGSDSEDGGKLSSQGNRTCDATIRVCSVTMLVVGDLMYNVEYRRGSDTRNAMTELDRGIDTVRLFGAYFNSS